MDNDINSDNYNLWLWLTVTHDAIFRARNKELARNNSSTMQALYLNTIYILKNDATIAKISEYTFREMNTTSEYITRMVNSGLVKRVNFIKNHENRVVIRLTAKGLNICKKVEDSAIIDEILSSLNVNERNQLRSYLKTLRDHALKALGIAPPENWPLENKKSLTMSKSGLK